MLPPHRRRRRRGSKTAFLLILLLAQSTAGPQRRRWLVFVNPGAGRPEGPYTTEQLQEWASAGYLDSMTRVQDGPDGLIQPLQHALTSQQSEGQAVAQKGRSLLDSYSSGFVGGSGEASESDGDDGEPQQRGRRPPHGNDDDSEDDAGVPVAYGRPPTPSPASAGRACGAQEKWGGSDDHGHGGGRGGNDWDGDKIPVVEAGRLAESVSAFKGSVKKMFGFSSSSRGTSGAPNGGRAGDGRSRPLPPRSPPNRGAWPTPGEPPAEWPSQSYLLPPPPLPQAPQAQQRQPLQAGGDWQHAEGFVGAGWGGADPPMPVPGLSPWQQQQQQPAPPPLAAHPPQRAAPTAPAGGFSMAAAAVPADDAAGSDNGPRWLHSKEMEPQPPAPAEKAWERGGGEENGVSRDSRRFVRVGNEDDDDDDRNDNPCHSGGLSPWWSVDGGDLEDEEEQRAGRQQRSEGMQPRVAVHSLRRHYADGLGWSSEDESGALARVRSAVGSAASGFGVPRRVVATPVAAVRLAWRSGGG
ncbi:unnamed protein product, partial [Phaeothamnion confervicola]